jgi:fructose-bisphosphate aldolase class II
MSDTKQIMEKANSLGVLIPAFNVAHLPMTEPIIRAVKDTGSFALVEVSRVDWEKMGAVSYKAVADEYSKHDNGGHTRLHLDHVPVIDEDGNWVDYRPIIEDAVGIGYESVMIDASRLDLEENIRITREMADLAHENGVPIESELGAVLGHEAGPPPPYEELFSSGKGFTEVKEAEQFVEESKCDFLSVAVGNIHGAVSESLRGQKKPEARLNIEHLRSLRKAAGIPLVLHGGSGVQQKYILEAAKNGITKVNVGTEIRQAYEAITEGGGPVENAAEAVYDRVCWMINEYYKINGSYGKLFG